MSHESHEAPIKGVGPLSLTLKYRAAAAAAQLLLLSSLLVWQVEGGQVDAGACGRELTPVDATPIIPFVREWASRVPRASDWGSQHWVL